MAGEDKVLKVLLQIQSDLEGITQLRGSVDDLKKSLDDTGKSAFSWGDAFKFAGAQEALRGVLEGVKAVGEEVVGFLEKSVEKAAELQTEAFPISALVGNAQVAQQVLTGLDSAWQQFGVVSNQALADATRGLLLLNTPAENLMARLTEVTKISLAAGVSLQDVVSAYSRFETAIINRTEVFTRGMGGFGAATIALLDVLQDHFGKTRDQIQTMLKTGQISLKDLIAAMREATDTGGRFGSVITEMKETFNGAVQAMKTAWEGFEADIGKPILAELTPVINRITDIEKEFTKIAQDQGWQAAIRIAWDILTDEIGISFTTGITTSLTKFAPNMAHAFLHAFWEGLKSEATTVPTTGEQWVAHLLGIDFVKGASKGFADTFITGMTAEMQAKKADLQSMLANLLKPESVEDRAWREAFGGGAPLMPEVPEELGQVGKKVDEVAEAMRRAEAVMQSIHQEQQLIEANPLLPVDAKDRLLVQSYANELVNLQAQISKLNTIKSTLTDPAKIAELDGLIQKLTFDFNLLTVKLTGLQQPLRADLAAWVNSFGNSAHQIAGVIEGSINASLQGTNQLLLDAAFRTGNWRQTVQGVERQILDLFLTWLEQMALQQAASLLHITTTTSAQVSSGAAIASAHAPAAAATSISSGGLMAILGEAAAVAAIIAIMAAFKMHEGGPIPRRRMHSGGLAPDEVPIIAQEGEIMIQRSVAQAPGMMEFLLGLNAGMFHRGGGIKRLHVGGDDFDPGGEMSPWSEYVQAVINEPGSQIPNVPPEAPGQSPWDEPTPIPGIPPDEGPGPQVIVVTSPRDTWTGPEDFGGEYGPLGWNPWNFGFTPPIGTPGWLQGPTMIPTNFDPQGYPYAVPVGYNPTDPVGAEHIGQQIHSQHGGGPIGRFHLGGSIARAPRLHSGASLGRSTPFGKSGRGAINIYAFMDRRELAKQFARDRAHQKIIFDFIKGRRIDLGIGG